MFPVELLFSQHFIKHCPHLNLLSLIDETELTDNFTLTASLTASDEVQVILRPSTTEIDLMEVPISSLATPYPQLTSPLTTGTGMTQNTETSLFTLIVVVIGALSVCVITTIISCTVMAACYCQRAKTQRTVTNAVEPSMFEMVDNHSYSGLLCVNTGRYDIVKPKTDPLPKPPEEQYEEIESIAQSVDNPQTKT